MQQVLARPAAAKAEGRDGDFFSGWPRPSFGQAVFFLITGVLAIEALLAFRVWVQLSGEQLSSISLRALYSLSSELVAPFAIFETTTPVDPNGVLELATIVAIEGYLVLGALLFGVMVLTRRLVHAVSGTPAESHGQAKRRARRAVARQSV